MNNSLRKRILSIALIAGMVGLGSPFGLSGQGLETGRLVGYVYDADGTTPIEGAIVTVKNVSTGRQYQSGRSGTNGQFTLDGISNGMYIYGVTTSVGDFNSDNLIGIQPGKTANVSIVLSPYDDQTSAAVNDVYDRGKIDGEALIGEVQSYDPITRTAVIFIQYGFLQLGDRIHVRGLQTDFRQDVENLFLDGTTVDKAFAGSTIRSRMAYDVQAGDLVYIDCKKGGAMPLFFSHPCGIAALVAGAGFITLGIIELTEEVCVSPFKAKK